MDHTCTRRLFCELTEDELLARGKELAVELTGIVKLEIERSALNAKIKPKKERVDELAVIIDQKKEERDVKCQWFHDWNGGKKTLRRLDTFEDLETDIIREWERQQHLKFTGEVAPAGYDVDDSELTETDEKARVVSEAAEGEEESEAATEPDPLANEHGVYVDAEEITVPLPAKARATASINVIQCSDGFWRSGHNHHMRDCGGGGGMPSVKSMGHCTKYDAMLDALDGLVSKFEDYTELTNSTAASRAKIAIEAIDEFRAGLVKGDSAA